MAGHSASKTRVNTLVPGHPRLACGNNKKDVDARHRAGHDDGEAGANKLKKSYRGGLITSLRRVSTSGGAA